MKWRVGGKVPLNVYEGERPMFQCHTPEDAARIVRLLNGPERMEVAYIDHPVGHPRIVRVMDVGELPQGTKLYALLESADAEPESSGVPDLGPCVAFRLSSREAAGEQETGKV